VNPERWRRIKELHARARELAESERRAFLEQECEGDGGLVEEVFALLAGDSTDSFLETPNLEGKHAPQPSVKTTLGDFELLDLLGRGGMGVVYRARQKSLDREVAVKVLPRTSAMEQRRVDRFQREALAAAKLEHPSIVPVYSVGEDEGLHYFAMQYIVGRSLNEELNILRDVHEGQADEQPLLPAFDSKEYITAAARLTQAVASGLHHAHEHGVVHRDVKPQNLLLDLKARVHIADFGLAKVEELGTITKSGEIAGTPYYMSPEQALAKRVRVDHRTDVFSLGVVLYELLTLHRPFGGSTSHQVLYAISFSEPRSIRKSNPRVPRDLETICIKALSKKPDNRYATAGDLDEDLQRFLNHEAIQGRRPSPVSRVASHVSRRRSWYVPLVASLGVLALGSFFVEDWFARRQVLAKVQPLIDALEADDLEQMPIEALVHLSEEAHRLSEEGTPDPLAEWVEPVLRRIESIGLERKAEGLEKLNRGLMPPPDTPFEEYELASDPDYFMGLRLLHEAQLLLPADEKVAFWANPRNTFPELEVVSDGSLDGADVYLQAVDPWAYQIRERRLVGQLPLAENLPIEPGTYRVVIVQDAGGEARYSELTRVVNGRGRTYRLDVPPLRDTSSVTDGMILIPAGEYQTGYADDQSAFLFQRERTVVLPSYWIDRTEVTNAEYRGFMQATGYAEPYYWNGDYRTEWDDLPVIGVEYAGALAYAEWAGKRLPTKHEWEVAARGPESFLYPWGMEAGDVARNAIVGRPFDTDRWATYLAEVRPVGTTPTDVGPFGLADTLGNVSEWTESVAFVQDTHGDPVPSSGSRVAKGLRWDMQVGAYTDLVLVTDCPVRGAVDFGFRCAKGSLNP
jgi:serine/threonine protein kinase/formylglycine-generating enzyme required for sulfatase activity